MNWIPIQTEWSNGYLETIDPQKIVQYQECQPRVNGTDPEVVTEYALDMRVYDEELKDAEIPGWKKFPHLCCVKTGDNQHILVSGFHRLDAILKVGYEKIDVYCIDGTLQDAIVMSKGENANNGVRRTNLDIKYVVQACLLDDELKQWSNPQIAKWCGVSAQTVNNHEKSLAKFVSENKEDYLRPTRRKRLSKHGEIEWIETAKIGNGDGKQAKSTSQIIEEERSEERKPIEKETALEHLYQNRQDFQTAVSDFAQSGAYLNFAYCRRRIKSLVDLEDATDEGSTDYTQWDLQKIKAQSQIAAEGVQVIRGYLEEDPKIETHPVAERLSEMQRISEIHQSAKLDTYTRPFQHQPLSDAALKVEKLWTADWEAKSDEARLDDLNALEDELPSLIAAEDTARKDVNQLAGSAYFAARSEIEKIVSNMGIDLQEFYEAAKAAQNLESHTAIFNLPDDIRRISSSTLFNAWCEDLAKIRKDIEDSADWVVALIPIPKRELVLVSIGINNNTDDEFEVVEFTDESSDEIRCDLNALPEDLRTALLKLASEMIYAEQTEESS